MSNESIIQVFEGQNIRIVWNEKEEKYYFAVADIVQVLTDNADVKQYIKRMRSRDSELDSVWGTIVPPTNLYQLTEKNMQSIVLHWKAFSASSSPSLPKKPNP